MKLFGALVLFIGLAGCASHPVPADWQLDSRNALQAATTAYLEGKDRIADAEMRRARQALAATGRPELLARAELVRCAAQVASLVLDACTAYAPLAADAAPAERAYAAYLYGKSGDVDTALLPAQHRGSGSTAGIENPLARLVATAVRLQRGNLSDAEMSAAVDAASVQGWRRPLLAWLGLAQQRAQSAGQADEAERLQRRIDLVGRPI
jgi:hypothetical protein